MTLKINGQEILPGKWWDSRCNKKMLIGSVHPDPENAGYNAILGWDGNNRAYKWNYKGFSNEIEGYDLMMPLEKQLPIKKIIKTTEHFAVIPMPDDSDDERRWLRISHHDTENFAKTEQKHLLEEWCVRSIIVKCPSQTIEVEIEA